METRPFSAEVSGEDITLTNQLSESRSPYVRGHMNNPVAWQMWTPETLALARKSNRLLFVSIGYAACHWCHVMERESFENPEIAKILNRSFIPIKIDREERPDIDRIYMNYVQATTGGGGWPLNVFLTPDLEPIFGGTYWPGPASTSSVMYAEHVGFMGILEKIRDVWVNQRQRCLDSAKEITAQLKQFAQEGTMGRTGGEEAGEGMELELLEEAYTHYAGKYDIKHAGFGAAPKFPTPANLQFLLRLGQYPQPVKDVVGEKEVDNAKTMAISTLSEMSKGGIHDQIGNGFARYSVTRDWSLPHFEKMLYDQAQLLPTYLDAYLVSPSPLLLATVHDIATYLTSPPLAAPDGGFFSAEDADSLYRPSDSEKREGAFYVWTLKELNDILGEHDAAICASYWSVQENGNVEPEYDAHDELINQNVLAIRGNFDAIAKDLGLTKEKVENIIENGRRKLREHREKERPRPSLDDKIVVSWNGLAIGALARTAAVLTSLPDTTEEFKSQASTYLTSALRAATFLKQEIWDPSKQVLTTRVWRDGPGTAPAFADDYAFLISGLLDLYDATFDDAHLRWATELQAAQNFLFWDESAGGFFSTADGQGDLLLRLKDGMDNAEPSTNGMSARNLNRLGKMIGDEGMEGMARRTAEAFEAESLQHPFLFTGLLDAVVWARLGGTAYVVTGEGEGVKEVLDRLRRLPQGGCRTLVRIGGEAKSDWLKEKNELLRSVDPEKVEVMVCEGTTCRIVEPQEVGR
ncbi:hypothetical protein K402DRAFT_389503 [Aulographum hederae CBS 113979]|uniref:Spermatogenesis-associated protein 20-like TRX domain-containing protein n=1 Tax=Aulographum hederae CBS 113979 TaxID=1176131 RepID=A0A6G1HBH6_9PEZI|nr:hypothetical protein K402DRAFT_389503 [Aulographum hederae CBS 113979]